MNLATAQAQLDAWLAADLATATGQAYTIGNRSLTRADAKLITDKITYWQRAVSALTSYSYGHSNVGVKVATWR